MILSKESGDKTAMLRLSSLLRLATPVLLVLNSRNVLKKSGEETALLSDRVHLLGIIAV